VSAPPTSQREKRKRAEKKNPRGGEKKRESYFYSYSYRSREKNWIQKKGGKKKERWTLFNIFLLPAEGGGERKEKGEWEKNKRGCSHLVSHPPEGEKEIPEEEEGGRKGENRG